MGRDLNYARDATSNSRNYSAPGEPVSIAEVTIGLPFFVRLEDCFVMRYDDICQESRLPELLGKDVVITSSRKFAGTIDKSVWPKERTSIAIKVETPTQLSGGSVDTFAIQNCLEIINRLITSYQATTGEVSNAGFIFPLGTSGIQLFADIRVNGQDIRDRWPSHSINTLPLANDEIEQFKYYITGQRNLPLSRVFLTNAILSLERGQYPLAVLQGATAVELRATQIIRGKLKAAGWSEKAIEPYEKMTLGNKLKMPQTDPRSLETYFNGVSGFANVYKKVKEDLTPLRNCVAHRGYLVPHQEAERAVKIARDFLTIVN